MNRDNVKITRNRGINDNIDEIHNKMMEVLADIAAIVRKIFAYRESNKPRGLEDILTANTQVTGRELRQILGKRIIDKNTQMWQSLKESDQNIANLEREVIAKDLKKQKIQKLEEKTKKFGKDVITLILEKLIKKSLVLE